ALVAAAIEEVALLERLDYRDFKISVKSTHVPTMIRAYRMLSGKVPYPLHLGVTEAGTPFAGSIKSAVGMGALLADGIGDTLRVSLTADPVKEIEVGYGIGSRTTMIARASQLFIPTLRDAPADAEAVSHKLLARGGFIRQVSAGLWTFMPLGWRVHRRIEQIIREEMDAIGAQEMLMP